MNILKNYIKYMFKFIFCSLILLEMAFKLTANIQIKKKSFVSTRVLEYISK